jgi:hypothetical protein
MESQKQLFKMIEPSKKLESSILSKIKIEETKRTVYKIVFSFGAFIISISTGIIFAINIIKDASQSGLSDYLSLIFSDGSAIISFWQSYMMSIAESLPIIPIAILVASIWIFVWSLNTILVTFKNSRSIFYKTN